MEVDELKAFLSEVAISQVDLARLLGVTPRAVALWVAGGRGIPDPAAAYIRLFRLLPVNLRQVELNRLKQRGSEMRDGMFGITFQGRSGSGAGVLIFDTGRVYGTDEGGARYDGGYIYDENTGRANLSLKVTFPPNGETVLGIRNPYEWSIDVAASLDPKQDSGQLLAKTSVGQPIKAQFKFLRPLPDAT